jgi:outer membrane protein assembly factor BamB
MLVQTGADGFREVALPAPVGARPAKLGGELIVPGDDGRVYLIDPLKGEVSAEPLVPPFDRKRPTRWRDPAAAGSEAVILAEETGRVRRLVKITEPRPRLVVQPEIVDLGKEIVAGPVTTGGGGAGAVVVATSDGRVRALSARDLTALGAWPLAAPLALPPVASAGRCYFADTDGGVLALNEEGQRLWSTRLGEKGAVFVPSGAPATRGDLVYFLTRDGMLLGRSTGDGQDRVAHKLSILPARGPIVVGDDLAVPVGLGSIRLLSSPASTSTSQ